MGDNMHSPRSKQKTTPTKLCKEQSVVAIHVKFDKSMFS